jgi:hypothetical protein
MKVNNTLNIITRDKALVFIYSYTNTKLLILIIWLQILKKRKHEN